MADTEHYYVTPTGSDTAGNGTSWGTAYATMQFAVDDIWATHTPQRRNVIYCSGDFSISTPLDFSSASPVLSLAKRVIFIGRGKDAVDDGQRTAVTADDNVYYDTVSDYLYWFGFNFKWNQVTSLQKCFRVDRGCEWHDCVFDGEGSNGQIAYQGLYNNQFHRCQFLNMYKPMGNHSIGGIIDYCFCQMATGRSGGFGTYRGGGISNSVVLSQGSAFNMTAGAYCTNNTAIQTHTYPSGTAFSVGSGESSFISNNYCENFTFGYSVNNATPILQDNFCYNSGTPLNYTTSTDEIEYGPRTRPVIELSQPLYNDAQNLDFSLNYGATVLQPWANYQYPGAVALLNKMATVAARVRG